MDDNIGNHTTVATITRPTLNVVVLQGSAGNGKTTCLLRSSLTRAKMEEKVIFVAATQIFADSVEQDLKGHISKDFRIIVKDKFTELIRKSFEFDLNEETEVSVDDVIAWIDEIEAKKGKKMDKGAKRAVCDWLMKGHREANDTENYEDFVQMYNKWKNENKKRDEGDMWRDILTMLTAENFEDEKLNGNGENLNTFTSFSSTQEDPSNPPNACGSLTSTSVTPNNPNHLSNSSNNTNNNTNNNNSTSQSNHTDAVTTNRTLRLRDVDRECDTLVIDEAQLYPAETYFKALLLWYRPRKALLLGEDTQCVVTRSEYTVIVYCD